MVFVRLGWARIEKCIVGDYLAMDERSKGRNRRKLIVSVHLLCKPREGKVLRRCKLGANLVR